MNENSRYGIVGEDSPRFGFSKCDECGEDCPSFSQSSLPEHGTVLNIVSMGYYAGFTDFFPGELDEKEENFRLCHDCSVRLMKALPGLGARIGSGCHPCDDETPCCEWAWRTLDGALYTVNDGEWVPVADNLDGR